MIAPFPWFGGKRTVAPVVWARFGNVSNYVEPFFGSGAVLLGRPGWTTDKPLPWIETVNDKDGYVSNFWRTLKSAPDDLLNWSDWPVNENDLHARHIWLVGKKDELTRRLEGDPDYYDAKIAGWWLWGICLWIGGGWCSGLGPWQSVDGEMTNTGDAGRGVNRQLVHLGDAGRGVNRQLVHLGNAGMGVNRKLVHLGDAGMGVNRQLVHLGNAGMGVNRKLVHLGNAGMGVNRKLVHLGNAGTPRNNVGQVGDDGDGTNGREAWIHALAARLERVRVCSGDWERVCGPTPTHKNGLTGVFLDPPYSAEADRTDEIYTAEDLTVAHDVRRWCVANGDNPLMRIALCGYMGEHDDDLLAAGWEAHEWKSRGGYGSQGNGRGRDNSEREVIWFSPYCLKAEREPVTLPLFADDAP